MKRLNLLLSVFIITSMLVYALALPALADSELSNSEITNDDIGKPISGDTVSFTLRARWGFVRGNPATENLKDENEQEDEDNDADEDENDDDSDDNSVNTSVVIETTDTSSIAKNYDGSIYAGNNSQAKISLVKKDHFEGNDTITSKANPVSWESRINGHWDGVYVQVLAKVDANIVVNTTKGSITKTAKEWYLMTGHAVKDFGGKEMLDVQTNKNNNRRHGIVVMWGKKDQKPLCPEPEEGEVTCDAITPVVDFSGNLTMDSTAFAKLLRELRFEDNDSVDEKDRSHIAWTSKISTHRDGLYTFMLPARDSSIETGFTITLDNINDGWSKHYTFDDTRLGVRDTIEINGLEYVVIVGQKTVAKQLVKSRRSGKLYLIENNIKHEVPNDDILNENGLDEDEAIEIDDEELEIFSDGEDLTYPDGTVLKDGNKTYVISDGIKRLLANAKSREAFAKVKAIFTNIKDRLTNKLQVGEDVTSDEGIAGETLVKVPGSAAVWKINGNKKKFFHRAKVFEEHKFGWDKVKTITQTELDGFDFAGVVTYPDGSLVKTREINRVFLIDNGNLRWIEGEEDFNNLGFDFGDVIDIQFEELALYGEGDPVISE